MCLNLQSLLTSSFKKLPASHIVDDTSETSGQKEDHERGTSNKGSNEVRAKVRVTQFKLKAERTIQYKEEHYGCCNSSCLVWQHGRLSHRSELTVCLSQFCSNL